MIDLRTALSGRFSKAIAILLLVAGSAIAPGAVRAADLIDLTPNAFVTWFETLAAGDRLAQAFATSVSANVITSVSLNLYSVDGNPRTFDLEIWSNSGGNTPNSFVANVVTGGSIASFSDQNFYQLNGLSITLQASTNYWLVLRPSGAQQIRWGQTDNLSGGFTGFGNAVRRSTDSGSTWPETTNVVQTRTRITAVPEPSSLWLVAAMALGTIGGIERLRSKRA